MFQRIINLIAFCIFFNTLGAQTCDVDLIGFDPETNQISIAILNSENCGCNEYTQQDGNTCDESSSSVVNNNESITHFVFGLHIYEDYTPGPCSQANYHPGWTFAYPPDQTTLPFTGGHVTGDTVNVQLITFNDWDCLLNTGLEEGQCWQLVVWQINLSQSADINDFPTEFWTDTCGTCAEQTQMYPDVDLSNNTLVWCPGELPPPPLYPGCMDSEAINFDPSAGYDDGTCEYPAVLGCTFPTACNYDQLATENDGSCVFCDTPGGEELCNAYHNSDTYWEWYSSIFGCEEELAVDIEIDSLWVFDTSCNIFNQPQGACAPGIRFHTIASNVGQDSIYSYLFEWEGPNGFYNATEYGVNFNGGDNFYAVPLPPGQETNTINSYTSTMMWEEGDTLCVTMSVLGQDEEVLSNNSMCITLPAMPVCIWGCTDPAANNYNEEATCDTGNCQYPIFGCTDPVAGNYNPEATDNDGSCEYANVELLYIDFECDLFCDSTGAWYNAIVFFDNVGDTTITDFCVNWDVIGAQDMIECFEGELLPGDTYIMEFGPITSDGGGGVVIRLETLNGEETDITWFQPSACFQIAESTCVYGCTDPEANNYLESADFDDGSCTYDIFGCTDSGADNYDPDANIDNGACEYLGCTDVNANNYDETANTDDGSCEYNYGCTDPEANNFDPTAYLDDGSCTYDVFGCTDPEANNYDSMATIDDGSCTYDVLGCTDSSALNYNSLANVDDGSCEYDVFGCTDSDADNYNPLATVDDGSCYYVGPDCEGEDGLIFAPNTFTPNNDGVNDGWSVQVANPDCWKSWYVAIYNRWGGLIWESTTPGEVWPGSVFDGNHYVADGVYVYLIRGEGWEPSITFKKSGHITIFR